jgi:hypothetical protein
VSATRVDQAGDSEHAAASRVTPSMDDTSPEWRRSLRTHGARRDEAVAGLHALLLRA